MRFGYTQAGRPPASVLRRHRWVWCGLMPVSLLVGTVPVSSADPESPRATPAEARDKLLRCVSSQAAVVVYAQHWHLHWEQIRRSPFATGFPRSALGQRCLQSDSWQAVQQTAATVFKELQLTPEELLTEIIGEGVVFAYSPGSGSPKAETSLLAVVPRRPATLQALVQRINELQLRAGEVLELQPHRSGAHTYTLRKKPGGVVDSYVIQDGLFLYSNSPQELESALDRLSRSDPPVWTERLQRWGVAGDALVVAIQPQQWAGAAGLAEAAANPPLLRHWARLWSALQAVVLSLQVSETVDVRLILEAAPARLPPAWRNGWMAPAVPSARWLAAPDAWAGVHVTGSLGDWLDRLDILLPPEEHGQRPLSEGLEQFLGPLVGRDRYPLIRQVLGPTWSVWLEPPAQADELPAVGAAVSLQGTPEQRRTVAQALAQALTFAWHALRVHYNASHQDQITWQQPPVGTPELGGMLVNPRGFPPGLAPCFACSDEYLLVATHPVVFQRFEQRRQVPTRLPKGTGPDTIAWLDVRSLYDYLQRHKTHLPRRLAPLLELEEARLQTNLKLLTELLEPVEAVRLDCTRKENVLSFHLRCRPRWSLRPVP
ncbi:MAG: hypothetical protein NZU63_10080 [Gemmataceae bacterium]|nr:hypothetical protein [Gemmataceae bacterium]MDW8242192.1 hypothetical protein [Thermogemmata sp.]